MRKCYKIELEIMKEFEYMQKVAILRILVDIMNADGIIRSQETEYIDDVAQSLGLAGNYMQGVKNMDSSQAVEHAKTFSNQQKSELSKIIGRMIVVDNDINYSEVRLYNSICESCDIVNDFNIEDYPNCIISGL